MPAFVQLTDGTSNVYVVPEHVIAIERAGTNANPKSKLQLTSGVSVVVVGATDDIKDLLE